MAKQGDNVGPRLVLLVAALVAGLMAVRSVTAAPADALGPLRKCGLIADDAARLACYDQALAAIDTAAAQAVAQRRVEAEARAKLEAERQAQEKLAAEQRAKQEAAQRAKEAKQAAARAEQAKRDAFGAEQLPKGHQILKPEEPQNELKGTITELLTDAFGNIVVVLDNGQVWRQTDSASLPPVRVGDAVTIQRGILGSFRMTFVKQRRTVEVKRFR